MPKQIDIKVSEKVWRTIGARYANTPGITITAATRRASDGLLTSAHIEGAQMSGRFSYDAEIGMLTVVIEKSPYPLFIVASRLKSEINNLRLSIGEKA